MDGNDWNPVQKDRDQQRNFVARGLLTRSWNVRLLIHFSRMSNLLRAQLQLQYVVPDARFEHLRIESVYSSRHQFDLSRPHALREVRTQDHLVSRRERSRAADSRHHTVHSADG